MVAIIDEAAQLELGQTVLEVGAGSGYQAATIAEIVGSQGHVFAVEILEDLARSARINLERAGYSDRITLVQDDGSKGYAERAPYDRIIVTAAAPRVPAKLVEQLKLEGILIIPVGARFYFQQLVRIKKRDGRLETQDLGEVAFVPLLGEEGFSP